MRTIVMAGCGALGSRIAMQIGFLPHIDFILIDDDVVSQENVGTSDYWDAHIGVAKVQALAEMLWFKYRVKAEPRWLTLDAPILTQYYKRRGECIVIDTFDNPLARLLTVQSGAASVLHAGVGVGGVGSIFWDKAWPVPTVDFERGTNPVCTNHLGYRILALTATVAAGAIVEYIQEDKRRNFIVTEKFQVTEV